MLCRIPEICGVKDCAVSMPGNDISGKGVKCVKMHCKKVM